MRKPARGAVTQVGTFGSRPGEWCTSHGPAGLPVTHDRAAGIDIGSRFRVAGVAPELCDEAVQTFQAFTEL